MKLVATVMDTAGLGAIQIISNTFLKHFFLMAPYSNVVQFARAYPGSSKIYKIFQNTLQGGKCMYK